jgi:rhodanese-related sulfurtransferase
MKQITATELEKLLNDGKAVNLIDVRETDEVESGKIPGAVNIPLGLIEFRIQDLDKSLEYILICRSGGRSSRAAEFLESRGFNVVNMTGGMLSWNGAIE